MTDLRHHLDAILGHEPAQPDNLEHIVAAGRRAVRRRSAVTGVAGTAGVAALTAAVVVPIVAVTRHNAPSRVPIGAQPTPSPRCSTIGLKLPAHRAGTPQPIGTTLKSLSRTQRDGITQYRIAHHGQVIAVRTCTSPSPTTSGSATPTPTPTQTGAAAPRYHYTEKPTRISHHLARALANRLRTWGLTVVYQRPFAQETSQLEKGHPTYFDGNDDVRVGTDLGDVGVQVTHAVTKQVPFNDPCTAPRCVQTTLPDGSVERISRIHAGTGGGTVIAVEVRHPNGLDVEAQQSNYGFGPEATRSRGSQPVTMRQLKSLAADPAFTF